MKTISRVLASLSIPILLSSTLLGQAYTTPVGAVSVEVPAGGGLISIPFQKPKVFQANVEDIVDRTLHLANFPALSSPAYIQVITGNSAGAISSIITSSLNTVEIESNILGLVAGDVIAIRPHFILSDLKEVLNLSEFDTITLLNPDGSLTSLIYFEAFGWYDEDQDLILDNLPIYPGEGFAINTALSSTATMLGTVSTDPVILPLPAGVSYVGTLNPVHGLDLNIMSNALNDFDTVTFYQNFNGTIRTDFSLLFFEEFGFYDENNDEIVSDGAITTGTAAAVNLGLAGSFVIPPAF